MEKDKIGKWVSRLDERLSILEEYVTLNRARQEFFWKIFKAFSPLLAVLAIIEAIIAHGFIK